MDTPDAFPAETQIEREWIEHYATRSGRADTMILGGDWNTYANDHIDRCASTPRSMPAQRAGHLFHQWTTKNNWEVYVPPSSPNHASIYL